MTRWAPHRRRAVPCDAIKSDRTTVISAEPCGRRRPTADRGLASSDGRTFNLFPPALITDSHRRIEVIFFASVQYEVCYRPSANVNSESSLSDFLFRSFSQSLGFVGNKIQEHTELQFSQSDPQNRYNRCQVAALHLQPI